ncbi:MAG: aconitate hydratase AcnA [Thermodesulfobacteriota bacterium]|nr:aconitate hydratase AcnA [Thermodesulfobacteriota bacterium]
MTGRDSFDTVSVLSVAGRAYRYFSLQKLGSRLGADLGTLPVTVRILLENLLRHEDGLHTQKHHIQTLAEWSSQNAGQDEIPFLPARVLMQDFTGVPAVCDLAAMRDAMARLGGDPEKINPRIPVHLVIDHSVQVDRFGCDAAFSENLKEEFQRNSERYAFLKWGQKNFSNFNVVPPATGICHQVNLEHLAGVVMKDEQAEDSLLYPDTLVGLDSHTTMINSLGVLGWGVGGIEAEAVMLGQPVYLLTPQVIGVRLTGQMPAEATATDLVLTITAMMRKKGVVGAFLEFFGSGLDALSLPDRATIANMTPEFGATATLFPADHVTLDYLQLTGRPKAHIALTKAYLEAQQLLRTGRTPDPVFPDIMEVDLSTVEPSLAGPRRPHERLRISGAQTAFMENFHETFVAPGSRPEDDKQWEAEGGAVTPPGGVMVSQTVRRKPLEAEGVTVRRPYLSFYLDHGAVVIAAITSCTNTSNPSVLMGAGLLAKKAVARGLMVRPWVKTSLAPGSTVVLDYLNAAGLLPYLEALRFHPVAYGCTTCIGNSGPLYSDVASVVEQTGLVVASVLSGNRNFEGRINPLVRANYLASPMLVIAYALAGTVNIDLTTEPLGHNPNNRPVFLKDIWPSRQEIDDAMRCLEPEMFQRQYADVYTGDDNWRQLTAVQSSQYAWAADSTYIQEPPFFQDMTLETPSPSNIDGARVLALLGDTITTDHISPAGAIPDDSPAAAYLREKKVDADAFNAYGARRGNHEVMLRGTFGNVRLANHLVPGMEGGWTRYLPTNEKMSVFDAAMAYQATGIPLIVIAGKDYGTGSSRDWAAKGTLLLGIRAVIAESFERIHRSNLVAMGVLPLQFQAGENAGSLGLTGEEVFHIEEIAAGLSPGQSIRVRAVSGEGREQSFQAIVRLDSAMEVNYYKHEGILPYMLRQLAKT